MGSGYATLGRPSSLPINQQNYQRSSSNPDLTTPTTPEAEMAGFFSKLLFYTKLSVLIYNYKIWRISSMVLYLYLLFVQRFEIFAIYIKVLLFILGNRAGSMRTEEFALAVGRSRNRKVSSVTSCIWYFILKLDNGLCPRYLLIVSNVKSNLIKQLLSVPAVL